MYLCPSTKFHYSTNSHTQHEDSIHDHVQYPPFYIYCTHTSVYIYSYIYCTFYIHCLFVILSLLLPQAHTAAWNRFINIIFTLEGFFHLYFLQTKELFLRCSWLLSSFINHLLFIVVFYLKWFQSAFLFFSSRLIPIRGRHSGDNRTEDYLAVFYARCPSCRNLLVVGNQARPFTVLGCTL